MCQCTGSPQKHEISRCNFTPIYYTFLATTTSGFTTAILNRQTWITTQLSHSKQHESKNLQNKKMALKTRLYVRHMLIYNYFRFYGRHLEFPVERCIMGSRSLHHWAGHPRKHGGRRWNHVPIWSHTGVRGGAVLHPPLLALQKRIRCRRVKLDEKACPVQLYLGYYQLSS